MESHFQCLFCAWQSNNASYLANRQAHPEAYAHLPICLASCAEMSCPSNTLKSREGIQSQASNLIGYTPTNYLHIAEMLGSQLTKTSHRPASIQDSPKQGGLPTLWEMALVLFVYDCSQAYNLYAHELPDIEMFGSQTRLCLKVAPASQCWVQRERFSELGLSGAQRLPTPRRSMLCATNPSPLQTPPGYEKYAKPHVFDIENIS